MKLSKRISNKWGKQVLNSAYGDYIKTGANKFSSFEDYLNDCLYIN